jgi:hypothetical protein
VLEGVHALDQRRLGAEVGGKEAAHALGEGLGSDAGPGEDEPPIAEGDGDGKDGRKAVPGDEDCLAGAAVLDELADYAEGEQWGGTSGQGSGFGQGVWGPPLSGLTLAQMGGGSPVPVDSGGVA